MSDEPTKHKSDGCKQLTLPKFFGWVSEDNVQEL